MAEENKNDNEEQDDFFGDDDDFGLPDLDYEALDDSDSPDEPLEEEINTDDLDLEIDESELDLDVEDTEIPDTFGSESEDTPAFEDAGTDDLDDILGDEPEPDMSSDDSFDISDEELGEDLLGDDSFADFDADSGSIDEEVPDSVFDSDIFDDEEFKEFESQLEETENEFSTESSTIPMNESSPPKGKFTRIVVIGTLLFAVLGFGFWYISTNFFGDDSKEVAQAPKKTPPKKQPTQRPKPTNNAAQKPAETASTSKPAQSSASSASSSTQASKPAPKTNNRPATTRPAATATTKPVETTPGTVNKLNARTGNTFIIIGSFVDGDMADDLARKLAAQGKSPSIIPPFGKGIFYRVAIASFPTIASAQQNIESFRNEYGRDVWALKY